MVVRCDSAGSCVSLIWAVRLDGVASAANVTRAQEFGNSRRSSGPSPPPSRAPRVRDCSANALKLCRFACGKPSGQMCAHEGRVLRSLHLDSLLIHGHLGMYSDASYGVFLCRRERELAIGPNVAKLMFSNKCGPDLSLYIYISLCFFRSLNTSFLLCLCVSLFFSVDFCVSLRPSAPRRCRAL